MISIVVTTYNRKEALSMCVGSILDQTYADFELIIIDDASTDDTEIFLRNMDDARIRYIKMEKNAGSTQARNKGLDVVTGDYVIVWDSDDILYPNALSTLLNGFTKYPDAITISAPTRVYAGMKEIFYEPLAPGLVPFSNIISVDYVKHKLARLSKASHVGQVRYVGRNLDFMFNSALAECGPWYQLDEYVGDHFLQSDIFSLTSVRRKPHVQYSIERVVYLGEYLFKYKQIMIGHNPGKYAAYSYGASLGFLLSGDNIKARHYAHEAFTYQKKLSYKFLCMLTYVPGGAFILKILFLLKRVLY